MLLEEKEQNCLTVNIVHQSEFVDEIKAQTKAYIGMTATTFTPRHRNHIKSFKNCKFETET